MHSSEALLLLTLCLGAYIAPALSRRIMLPPAVGEIFFGIAIAPFFHSGGHGDQIVGFLAELGFLILMYLAGLEIDFQVIGRMRRKVLVSYVSSIAFLAVLSVLLVIIKDDKPLMAVAYMTVAIGLLFPVLHDLHLLEKPDGQSLLVLGGIGEIFSLAGLTIASLYYQYGVSTKALIHFSGLILFVIGAVFITKIFRLLIWWFPGISGGLTKTGTASEMGVRANFVIMFVFVTGAALMDIEAIIGAFIGGMIFSLLFKSKEDIQDIFSGVGNGFLIPIFFINVGLNFNISYLFDLSALAGAITFSVLLLALRYIAMINFLFTGVSLKIFLIAPLALSFPLTLMVTVAMFGSAYNILSEKESAVLILSALLTAVVYPVMTKALSKKLYA